jgi:hypothetical protein
VPPRFAYWTILIDNAPTAFRAREAEELLPTLAQLRRTNENVILKWFARGRLWDSQQQERDDFQRRKWRPAPTGVLAATTEIRARVSTGRRNGRRNATADRRTKAWTVQESRGKQKRTVQESRGTPRRALNAIAHGRASPKAASRGVNTGDSNPESRTALPSRPGGQKSGTRVRSASRLKMNKMIG